MMVGANSWQVMPPFAPELCIQFTDILDVMHTQYNSLDNVDCRMDTVDSNIL